MILAVLGRVIATVALVVPRERRGAWREEWLAEVQQIARDRGVGAALHMATGLAADAWAVRQLRRTEAARAGTARRATPGIAMSWMDFTLAVRMLVRYPGLTIVGVLGMAMGITIAAGAFGIIYTLTDPSLPLDGGDRIVAVQTRDLANSRPERRIAHDFLMWREQLRSIGDLGAFRQVPRNLIASDVPAETIRVTEMSASGFTVARVPPLLGRHLVTSDERPDAAPVLVIGYDVWRNRFASDPVVVGRTVKLGDTAYLIVGVMPEGFLFPVNDRYWVPLRLDPSAFERLTGPALTVFGRLAPAVTFEAAQAELDTVGQRAASAFPTTHAHLRPMVAPYTFPFFDLDEPGTSWLAHLLQFLITLLLIIVCVNVAILVYARTATRHAEIAVRTALGASRSRIVMQLFVEALVLAGLAAVLGLAGARLGLERVHAAMVDAYQGLPFWWTPRVSTGTVIYVVGATILGAVIVGVVPALKATGRQVQNRLRGFSAGGGGMQLGRTWTVLIVAQVAIAVALLPAAVYHAWDSIRVGVADPGFAAEEFLSAMLTLDQGSSPPAATDDATLRSRYADRHVEVIRRLQAEPGVSSVNFATVVPGEEQTVWVEAEGVPLPEHLESSTGGYGLKSGSKAGRQARFGRVDVNLFAALDLPLLMGRPFTNGDAGPGATSIIVNRSFVQDILGGGSAVGRRVRYVGASVDAENVQLGRWYEIVGVVADFPARSMQSGLADAKLYHAITPADVYPATIIVRVRGTPAGDFAGRMREVVASVDANLQLRRMGTLDETLRRDQEMMRIVATVLVALTIGVLVLSSAGIYSLMSFTVAQRRKEIGIRTALGADGRRILTSIFSRALWQLASGAALGVGTAALLEAATGGELMKGNGVVVLPGVAIVMTIVGLLAAVGPARRGLRIHPTEALREQ